jgi:hypothetical protein
MLSSAAGCASGPIELQWNPNSDDRADRRRAGDREPPADLGRAAPHRVEAEVAGICSARVEAPSVVADLYEDVSGSDVHVDKGGGGVCVLDHIGERLAPDSKELGLNRLGKRKARDGSPHLEGRRATGAQAQGVPRERGNQSIVDRVATQFEDERANLGLHAPRELGDRTKGLPDTPGRTCALRAQGFLRRAGVEDGGEQRLGDRIM